MYCRKCGSKIENNNNCCENCGEKIIVVDSSKGLSDENTSNIFGIVSIVLAFLSPLLSLITSIIGLVFSKSAIRELKRKSYGYFLNLFSLIYSIIIFIISIVIVFIVLFSLLGVGFFVSNKVITDDSSNTFIGTWNCGYNTNSSNYVFTMKLTEDEYYLYEFEGKNFSGTYSLIDNYSHSSTKWYEMKLYDDYNNVTRTFNIGKYNDEYIKINEDNNEYYCSKSIRV